MQSITLQTSDSAITSSDILGRINFAASSESDGGAATLQVGSIYAIAEGTFSASANPTSIVIATSASDSNPAQNRIKITNEGHIHPMTNNSYDLGSSTLRYRAAYTNALTINAAYSFPTSDGSSNQVLQTNGAGQLSFATVSTGGLSNVVEDTTPQLGGDLDLNGNQILDCVTESSATTNVPLVVQGITSQSADLAQFKSTSSTLRTKIDTAGRMLFDVDTIATTPSTKGVGPYLKGVAIFDDNDGSMAFYVLRDGTSNYTRSNTNDFRLFTASSNNAVHLKAANTSFGTPTDGLAIYDNDGTTLGEVKCDYANVSINSTTANGITVTAAASQSAELQLWENSSATKLLAVGPDGGLEIPSATPSTTTNKLYNDGTNLRFGTDVIIDSTNVNTGLQWQPLGGGLNVTGLTTTEFSGATLVTAAEGIGSNNNDTTIPTSAAVKAYADSVAGGGGTPGGSDTQIQFNDGGSFGGDADLVWNKTTNALTITGSLNATTKSFLIDHPSKPGMKLQYASLEGPENGVYVRGTTDSGTITLPDYWRDLVHNGSITVTLTPVGQFQPLFVEQKSNREIRVGGVCGYYDYVVYGERKDVDKLEVEW